MRRKDRQLSTEEAYRLLEKGEWGVLSTFDGEYPYGVPVNYVFLNNSVYFHCAPNGYKIDNIKSFEKVCFTVVLKSQVIPSELRTDYASVILFGRAQIVEGQERTDALLALGKRFAKEYMDEVKREIEKLPKTTIVAIRIEEITAKASSKEGQNMIV